MKIHYPWLDLIRFLASFFVLVNHSRKIFIAPFNELSPEFQKGWIQGVLSMLNQGHMGVLIFFVLSGFLVGGRAIERMLNKTFDPRTYLIDRCVRIMWPLIGALIFVYLINTYIGNHYSILDYIGNLFSLQRIFVPEVTPPLWTLPYDMWAYILILGIGLLMRKKYGGIGAIVVFMTLIGFILLNPVYLFVWFMGVVGYALSTNKSVKKSKVLLMCSIMLLVITEFLVKYYSTQDFYLKYISRLAFSAAFMMFMVQIIQRKPISRIGQSLNRLGSRLAKFSYTLYLTHFAILELINYLWVPQTNKISFFILSVWAGSCLVCIIIAYFLYFIIDKHTNKIRTLIKQLKFG